jgi:hypothetical protein
MLPRHASESAFTYLPTGGAVDRNGNQIVRRAIVHVVERVIERQWANLSGMGIPMNVMRELIDDIRRSGELADIDAGIAVVRRISPFRRPSRRDCRADRNQPVAGDDRAAASGRDARDQIGDGCGEQGRRDAEQQDGNDDA